MNFNCGGWEEKPVANFHYETIIDFQKATKMTTRCFNVGFQIFERVASGEIMLWTVIVRLWPPGFCLTIAVV